MTQQGLTTSHMGSHHDLYCQPINVEPTNSKIKHMLRVVVLLVNRSNSFEIDLMSKMNER